MLKGKFTEMLSVRHSRYSAWYAFVVCESAEAASLKIYPVEKPSLWIDSTGH